MNSQESGVRSQESYQQKPGTYLSFVWWSFKVWDVPIWANFVGTSESVRCARATVQNDGNMKII